MKQYLDRFNTILEAEEEVTDKEAFTDFRPRYRSWRI